MRNPAAPLFCDFEGLDIGKTNHLVIALLLDEFAEIYSTTINSDGCAGLESFCFKTVFLELFSDAMAGYFAHPSSCEMLFTDMD